MNKNFTLSLKSVLLLTLLICFFSLKSISQSVLPKLKFKNSQLVSGLPGQKDAIYKFPDVVTGVDAFIKIENIVNGAILINIDESGLGYNDAWQPTVGSSGAYGSSYIKWGIEFKTTSGAPYTFPELNASAVDIDGDNARVREFIGVNGQSGYSIPNLIPSLLAVSNVSDTDNVYGDDPNATNLFAVGPVLNRTDIDTISEDVRIDYRFLNKSKIKIYTGSQIDDNGNTGGIASNRYHCIYFMKIESLYSVLPVTYKYFGVIENNNAVNLSWITDNELRNDYFEIERSFDQKEFSTIGMIMGTKSSKGTTGEYNFKDEDSRLAGHKVVYYRLKQVDISGSFTYSVIKMVSMSVAKMNVQVMPNPYMDKVKVNFVSDASGSAEVRLTNISGSLIKSTHSSIAPGYNSLQITDLNSQTPGIYIINVMINGKVIGTQKLLKQ